ncbi:MAG: YebC/PmpR family DNA-binding transcriptional regulator [Candidatus Omnitrophica bacterium]|nr:YebC/PmpR family DNA-binding transcriptional regulator [Candidatus Omnitrophota bacterium]MCM8802531.1 YebC/PmpR family DNA-binding transcriptional regulator [Candidatus Omnitrophota bacterium]
MSGHSKWHSIKHKKMAMDARKGKIFTKIIRELMVAAKTGGPNPETNPRLRIAIEKAKSVNMPNDNIQRAIKKGSGEEGGVNYEQVTYEGYGPGGVAIFVEVLTDNKNRSASEIRSIFSRHDGNLAGAGSVSWIFERKGLIIVKKENVEEDKLMGIIIDAGADDMKTEKDTYEIITSVENFENVKKSIEQNNIQIENASITYIPKNTVHLEGKQAETLLKLLDELEESEDVQNVYANFDISDEILEKVSK